MKKVLTRCLAVIGAATILLVALTIIAAVVWFGEGSVSKNTILEVDFETRFVEYIPDDPMADLMTGDAALVRDIVDALEKAADDEKIIGLVAHVGAGRIGFAATQEIREAVKAFRRSGKPAVAWSECFGEFSPGNGAYYLATAFDKIYLLPSGDVGLTGLLMESPFIRGTLDKLDIEPRLGQRYEYKNAANTVMEKKYTQAHRENLETIMQSIYNRMVQDIAEARSISADRVRDIIDHGPYYGQEAVDAGLIDELLYRDEVYDKMKETRGDDTEFLFLSEYLDRAGRPHEKGETIALIYGAGSVVRGSSGYDPLFSEITMGSATVAKAFRDAVDDDDVRAILFRVDSPGGSYVASDIIWRETVRAKKLGKPVIVSMGDVAASGGYFVSMAADKIVAQPGTITGSIGVFAGKAITTGLWENLGITWDEVHRGDNATYWTNTSDYNDLGNQRLNAGLDRIYEDFTAKVASGRNLPLDKVLEIAKGRVWTGEQALENGLIDELGGFPTALRLACEAAGISEDKDVKLKLFPEKKTFIEKILEDDPESSEKTAFASVVRNTVRMAQPALRLARELGLLDNPYLLRLPTYETQP